MRVHFSLLLLATAVQVVSSFTPITVPEVGTNSKEKWWKVKNGDNNSNNNNNNKRGVWSMKIRRMEHPVSSLSPPPPLSHSSSQALGTDSLDTTRTTEHILKYARCEPPTRRLTNTVGVEFQDPRSMVRKRSGMWRIHFKGGGYWRSDRPSMVESLPSARGSLPPLPE